MYNASNELMSALKPFQKKPEVTTDLAVSVQDTMTLKKNAAKVIAASVDSNLIASRSYTEMSNTSTQRYQVKYLEPL